MDPRGDDPNRRQLWNAGAATSTKPYEHCLPYTLPSLGVIEINPDFTVTLTANAVFTPECTSEPQATALVGPGSSADMRDPFHSSITPQAYATGAATVIAWMLVIMLLITPRTFFAGTGGRSGLMGRRGMISGASGGGSVIGVGTRPWLQKVAALTVAISLTMATADTFRIAQRQYAAGYMDAMALRDEVVSGMEIKVSRVISDIFLWLAQVQTLIRLFPRHKEKVIIKWTGFFLIMLDTAFSCLNSFMGTTAGRPRRFVDAIPALSYLFQLALSMLYAAWVIYYSITKRRYAFYHSMMWNISLVALLSFVAILTPVVFFITDISNYTVSGWGDYFRWVGAAAASVIVWEWVERIEALEREEKKDGILGREIFDGDEMLETTLNDEVYWPRNNRDGRHDGSGGENGLRGSAFASAFSGHGFGEMAHRLARTRQLKRENVIIVPPGRTHSQPNLNQKRPARAQTDTESQAYAPVPTPPPPVVSPVSRTDTTSASTVYTVRYHPISESPSYLGRSFSADRGQIPSINMAAAPQTSLDPLMNGNQTEAPDEATAMERHRSRWQAVPNPFKRRRASPPPEVQRGRVIDPINMDDVSAIVPPHNESRWGLKSRLGAFAAEQSEKLRERGNSRQVETNLAVTIIPAQPRGRTWSPEILTEMGQSSTNTASNPHGPTKNIVTDSTETVVPSAPQNASTGIASSPRIRFAPETRQRASARQTDLGRTVLSGPPTSPVPDEGTAPHSTLSNNDTPSP